MNRLSKIVKRRELRKSRVRKSISGTAQKPRMSVFISNRHITAQLIDDVNHKTLVYLSTVGNKEAIGSTTEKAVIIGKQIALKAKSAKIKTAVFDRGHRLYHGRVKALADSARENGLEI